MPKNNVCSFTLINLAYETERNKWAIHITFPDTYNARLTLIISSLQKVGFDAEIPICAQLHITHQINLQPDT
jgi:hypothetical protein